MSRKATQLAMGPWFVHDTDRPFMPGFNVTILQQQVAAGRIKADTIIRGPTTHQFWVPADQAPGVSRLLGRCHACGEKVATDAVKCTSCHADLSLPEDVDRLGLSYTTQAERRHAQAEVEALRAGRPAPPPPAESVSVPVDPTRLHADELQPVSPEPEGVPDDLAEVNEGLREAAANTPTRRVKRRRGQGPMIIGLAGLLLCMVTIGLFVVISTGPGGQDEPNEPGSELDTGPKPVVITYTADAVAELAEPIVSDADRLRSEGVPTVLADQLDQIDQLLSQAEQHTQQGQHTAAYNSYTQTRDLIETINEQADAIRIAEARQSEIAALRQAIASLRGEAIANDAERWSPNAWTSGETARGAAQAFLDTEQYEQAIDAFKQAEEAYQQASQAGVDAKRAVASRDSLNETMQAGYSEQTLRDADAAQVDLLTAKRIEGERHLAKQNYTEAERAFAAAAESLTKATRAAEGARYRKAYAFDAGYQAAGLLIAIAAGDGASPTAHASLAQAFDQLAINDNPASGLEPGGDNAYQPAAELLVNTARQAITSAYGGPVQACYEAGFQARIIEQTLTTLAMTGEQQKRLHQSLGVMEDQAAAAGWNLPRVRPVFDLVRRANRKAELGRPPEPTREAWSVLIGPLLEPDAAIRIMDPVTAPGSPDDPELFPGLGSSG